MVDLKRIRYGSIDLVPYLYPWEVAQNALIKAAVPNNVQPEPGTAGSLRELTDKEWVWVKELSRTIKFKFPKKKSKTK